MPAFMLYTLWTCYIMFHIFCLVLASYGVKAVKGENRLSGPGTASAEEPGIMAGGGRWPGRYDTHLYNSTALTC